MTEENDRLAQARVERAAEWRALQRERPLDAREKQEFIAWLRESPTHVAAYLEIVRVERDVKSSARDWAGTFRPLEADVLDDGGNVVPMRPSAPQTRRDAEQSRDRRRVRRVAFAAVASVVVMVLGTVFALNDGQRFGLPKAYETAHAEQGSWRLPDGSVLHLNSESRAVVHFSDGERVVSVERGQAMFQVAKDPARRFRVHAGDTQVIAVGTEFDVYRRDAVTRVVVLEGRVAVLRGEAPVKAPTLSLPGATPLSQGQQIEVAVDRPLPKAIPADVRRVRAWTQREIVLDASPLSEVVEDFNRYSSVPIEIDGDEIKTLQISGVFGAYDVESLVEFLRHLDGVRVERTGSRIRILPEKPRRPNEPQLVGRGPEPSETNAISTP